ncbi:MAG TPA: hypothetical protein VLT81_11045 [Chondromyces sp.]|nr:hypothetical protein [Chondromyces sp.]
MNQQLPGYRTSSARRTRGGPVRIAAAALGLLVLAILFGVLRPDDVGNGAVATTPTATPTPPRVATAAATPTAAAPVELSSVWVEVGTITPTPTPWPTLAPQPSPTATSGPSLTPRPADCVSFTWTSRQMFAPFAHVLVEIKAVNRCRRDLGPFDLWFEISGWRDGGLVQTVRGHPFDRIRPGASGIVAIGLPGSIDWYDEVRVEIVD